MTQLQSAGAILPESPPAAQPPAQSEAADARPGEAALTLHDLLMDYDELRSLLLDEVKAGRWLDSFLLAAGMNQIVEDHVHREFADLDRVRRTLVQVGGSPGRAMASALNAMSWAGLLMRAASTEERRIIRWQAQLVTAVAQLASAACGTVCQTHQAAAVSALLESQPPLPQLLRRSVIRLPTCFRSLDQKPEDLHRIVDEFQLRHPDRSRPLLVIGLRTSGSYLAPLYAQFLNQAGYRYVTAMTIRPGQRLLTAELRRTRQIGSSNGIVLLTDDPPKTGSSLAQAARALEGAGVPSESIKLLLPVLDGGTGLPEPLRRYETIVLPWERWEVHRLLQPDKLKETLGELLLGRRISPADGGRNPFTVGAVEGVETLDLGPRSDLKAGSPARRHIRSLLRVKLRDRHDGRRIEHLIYVKGVGLGYFGQHSLAVSDRLADFLPELYGIREGLLFRAWLPEAARISHGGEPAGLAQAVAEYVAARNVALRSREDKSLRTVGLNPLWQRTADFLGAGFGRQRALFRPALHTAAKKLLHVDEPSVVDGSMALGQWFISSQRGGRLVKVDYDERAFSNQDTVIDQLYSYDPEFDLAVAAADFELERDPELSHSRFTEQLVSAYESLTGASVAPERWLLYHLIHLSSQKQFVESLRAELESSAMPDAGFEDLTVGVVNSIADRALRASARADQRYLARAVLAGAAAPAAGPMCAIDLDGVLETGWLGYSSATQTGVSALRRLMRHGFRPMLATGRSLSEVIDRCRAFSLAGGVAEYGAVIYDHHARRITELVGEGERSDLDRIRARLQAQPGVHVDTAYRRIIRSSKVHRSSREPLDDELLSRVLNELDLESSVKLVHGFAQTDIVPVSVDKGRGTRALCRQLTGSSEKASAPPLAFAIGDSYSDLPLLAEALAGYAPANADRAMFESGTRIMKSSHQSGLAEAVTDFLGHDPRACAECREPALTRDARILLTAFSAGGANRSRKVAVGLRFALQQLT